MKGAIFDLDGTLLDSMPLWDDAGDRYLLSRGITPPEGLYEAIKEMGNIQTATYFQEQFSLTESVQELIDQINVQVEEQYLHIVPPKADIADFLEKLSAAGVRMCVATASDHYLAEGALARCGLLRHFSFILTCTEVGVGKTQPDIFERALEKLGTSKADTVIFEDAAHAIATAKAAGFYVAAIAELSAKPDEAKIRALADQYLERYADFKEATA